MYNAENQNITELKLQIDKEIEAVTIWADLQMHFRKVIIAAGYRLVYT